MERLNHEDSVYQTTHSHWTIDMNQRQNPPYSAKGRINSGEFNVYGLEWYPDKLLYTVNGQINIIYHEMYITNYFNNFPLVKSFFPGMETCRR